MRATLTANDLVFLGMKGTVLALHAATGAEVWRTPLKGQDFTNITLEGHRLIAAARGEVFCLDPLTGQLIWHNPLKGLGWGLITFASANQTAAAAYKRAADAQAANGATAAVMIAPATHG